MYENMTLETQTTIEKLNQVEAFLKELEGRINSQLLICTGLKILALTHLEKAQTSTMYEAFGYAQLGKKLLPMRVYYSMRRNVVGVWVGHMHFQFVLGEEE